jgi:hypothetical protein
MHERGNLGGVHEIRTNNRRSYVALGLALVASCFGMTPVLAWPSLACALAALFLALAVSDRAERLPGREGRKVAQWAMLFAAVGIVMSMWGFANG